MNIDVQKSIELGMNMGQILGELEKEVLETAIKTSRYNQTKAAKKLGISRGSFRSKLREHFGNKYFSNAE